MSENLTSDTPEINKPIDDNARKFVSSPIDQQFLQENNANSFNLIVDWLETGEDNEKKIAYKKYDNGDVQILLIAKHTVQGKRSSIKDKITEDDYRHLLDSSILRVEKRRHEFKYIQNDISFSINFDEFADSELYILEVDASNEEERSSFDPAAFPAKLAEVTGDISYYGYHVTGVI